VLLGPTADDIDDRTDTTTTRDGVTRLLAQGRRIMPALIDEEVTATYAGLRAATEHVDYCLDAFPDDRYVRLGGIRSTGMSSCLALAEVAVEALAEVPAVPLAHPVDVPRPTLAERALRPYADALAITADPAYGDVVCLCERVTRGEIRDALAGPVPPVDLDGLRRRTRALAGRCQGFHCGARVTAMLRGEAHA
jgi:glycerol-3-phosphate dehydrogenase